MLALQSSGNVPTQMFVEVPFGETQNGPYLLASVPLAKHVAEVSDEGGPVGSNDLRFRERL